MVYFREFERTVSSECDSLFDKMMTVSLQVAHVHVSPEEGVEVTFVHSFNATLTFFESRKYTFPPLYYFGRTNNTISNNSYLRPITIQQVPESFIFEFYLQTEFLLKSKCQMVATINNQFLELLYVSPSLTNLAWTLAFEANSLPKTNFSVDLLLYRHSNCDAIESHNFSLNFHVAGGDLIPYLETVFDVLPIKESSKSIKHGLYDIGKTIFTF